MTMRRGVENGNAGPHLPRDGGDFAPAKGGCMNCGDRLGVVIMDFQLIHRATGKAAGRWRLCQACWLWGNPPNPEDTDPLTAI